MAAAAGNSVRNMINKVASLVESASQTILYLLPFIIAHLVQTAQKFFSYFFEQNTPGAVSRSRRFLTERNVARFIASEPHFNGYQAVLTSLALIGFHGNISETKGYGAHYVRGSP